MASQPISIGIHGATGRMGTRLIQLIQADPELVLGAAIVRPNHKSLGLDIGPLIGLPRQGIMLDAGLNVPVDVVIDFSNPVASLAIAEVCAREGRPLVVGTTGFEPEQKEQLERFADRIPLLIAPNTSRAVNLLMKLVGEAARVLGNTADIEIVERHHISRKTPPVVRHFAWPTSRPGRSDRTNWFTDDKG